jgi:5-methylcytosine-specific restriction protein A
VGNSFSVKGSTGIGTDADVPWIGIFSGDSVSAQEGYYLVYLFAADGSAVYLSLNQGTEKLRGGKAPLLKRAIDMRTLIGPKPGLATEIDLRSESERPKRYEAGNVYGLRYDFNAIPSDDQLTADLNQMLRLPEYRKSCRP